jgi:ubiquinone/menaquinone biosynthesis C-methylase UbiE
MIWDSVPVLLNLTILNLAGEAATNHSSHHKICYVEGDACRVEGFKERSFDMVFSNSVIEHVGPADKQADFAREVRRLGKSYWVQTPSMWFPIEAHCGMPFWWQYPATVRRYFIERWRKKLPAWTQMVEETTVLTKADLQRLFPEGKDTVRNRFRDPKIIRDIPPRGNVFAVMKSASSVATHIH